MDRSTGGWALAEAFVRIRPDTDGFRRDADAQLKREMAGDKVEVPVDADLRPALSAMARLKALMGSLADRVIHVRMDTGSANRQIDALDARLAALHDRTFRLSLEISDADGLRRIARLRAAMASLHDTIRTIRAQELFKAPDPAQISRSLVLIRNDMRQLGIADFADANLDPGRIQASLQRLKILMQHTPGGGLPGIADLMDINIPPAVIASQLARLRAAITKVSGSGTIADVLDVNLNTAQIESQLARLRREISAGTAGEDIVIPARIIPPRVALPGPRALPPGAGWDWTATVTGTRSAAAGFEELTRAAAAAGGAFTALGPEVRDDSYWWKFFKDAADGATGGLKNLDTELKQKPGDMDKTTNAGRRLGAGLFGWGAILTGTIGHIGLWHVALDLAVESLLAVTLAAAAAAVGIAALTPVAIDVYNHISAVNQVNSALGDQIPVLGSQFRNFAESMHTAAAGVEIYGGVINIASSKTGILSGVASQVITLFEDWTAKIAIWANSQNAFGTLLQHGIGFLGQFGSIFGQLGQALANLVRADPGIARFLLDVVGAVTKLFDWVTKLPAPLIGLALGLHAVYVYGNVASGVLGKLVLGFSKMVGGVKALDSAGKALSGGFSLAFLFTPIGAAATVAAAGIGFLVYEMLQVPPAAQKAINEINQTLALNPGQFVAQFGATFTDAMGQLNSAVHLQQRAWVPYESQIHSSLSAAGKSLGDFVRGDALGGFAQLGRAITAGGKAFVDFWTGSVHGQQEQNAIDGLTKGLQELVQGLQVTFQETGRLSKQGFTVAQSFALMDLAGVQASDSFKLASQKVDDLLAGFKAMSIQGPLLANAVNAITFATDLQNSKVSQLNGAWDTFFQTVSSGLSAFLTFEQNLKTLDTAAGVSTAGLHLMSDSVLQTGQDFLTAAGQANTQLDALTSMAAAAGLGAHGTDLLASASKDLVATMLPAARGSQTLTTILYTLAQRGGYQGADSFQQLSKWVQTSSGTVGAMGKAGGPVSQLQGTVTTLTASTGNLTTDVQNLALALKQNLTGAMATAILEASGGQKAFTDFASAIYTTGKNSTADITAGTKLVTSLINQTGSVSAAKDAFMLFAKQGLHLTQDEANTLWNEISLQLIPTVQKTGTTAKQSSDQINSTFIKSLTAITSLSPQLDQDVGKFTSAVQQTGDTSQRTQGARSQLIRDLEKSGYSAQAAAGLVDGLQRQIDSLHGKSVGVTLDGGGVGTINYIQHGQGIPPVTGGLKFFAAGGKLDGFGGGDIIPAMLEPGEAVIDKNMTRRYAALFKAMGVRGFASGGVIGSAGYDANRAQDWMGAREAGFGRAAEGAFAAAAIRNLQADVARAVAQAQAQAAAAINTLGVGPRGPLSSSAAVAQAFARSILFAYGWGPGQFPYLQALWNQESGWNSYAVNPTSGAYGIPQALGHGHPYALGDYQNQIRWGLAYISQRYGSPAAAEAHELAFHWYHGGGKVMDAGGWLPPGHSTVYNGTGGWEHLSRDGGTHVTIELGESFRQLGLSEQQLRDIRHTVREKGGGNVQSAFGRNH